MWQGEKPIAPNLLPLGFEMHSWLLRQSRIRFISHDELASNGYTNEYISDTSVLCLILSRSINESHEVSHSTGDADPVDAELERVRLYSEQVLYTARICEALIKQMLYCTTIPQGQYRGVSLGGLLSRDCIICQASKSARHKLSMIGSLACRYHQCHAVDHCLAEHMKLVHRRRDVHAAHSGVLEIQPRTADESRLDLAKSTVDVGNEFVHVLRHIADIETAMLKEMHQAVLWGMDHPWWTGKADAGEAHERSALGRTKSNGTVYDALE